MNEVKAYQEGKKLYVTTNFICAYKGVDRKTVSDWKARGLKKYKLTGVQSHLFMIDEVDTWVSKNINENKQRNSKSSEQDEDITDEEKEAKELEKLYETYTNGSIEEKRRLLIVLPQNKLDNFKKMEEILEKEYKNREADKEWIKANKPANAMRELAILFISSLKNSIPVLSKELENKTQDENAVILDREFGSIINNVNKTASIETKEEERFIDVIEEIKAKILNGVSIKTILKKLREK